MEEARRRPVVKLDIICQCSSIARMGATRMLRFLLRNSFLLKRVVKAK